MLTMVWATITSKPTSDPAFVDRPRLYQRLDAWPAFRALVIQAPAGYGKSSLASRWIDASGLDRQAAWLSLSEDESDLRQFVAGFAAALDPKLPGLAQALHVEREPADVGPIVRESKQDFHRHP